MGSLINISTQIFRKPQYLLLLAEGDFGGPPFGRGSRVGKALLREALVQAGIFQAEPLFATGFNGKPLLANYPLWHFNITHCDLAVACVLSQKETGIDAEVIRPEHLDLVPHVLNSAEQQQVLQSDNPPQEFCRLWTRKESLLKCTGEGLRDDMRHVLETNSFGVPVEDYAAFEAYHGEGYEMCVCLKNDKN